MPSTDITYCIRDCGNNMKLIDILVMISKGELKEGTKIKYNNIIYVCKDGNVFEPQKGWGLLECIYEENLNDEVEIIEPDHFADDGKMATYKIEELDKEEIMHLTLPSAIAVITDVLNKAINKVNVHSTVLLAQEKEIKEIKEQLDY